MRPSGVGFPHPVRRDVDDVAEPPLALGQRGVALDGLGGVRDHPGPQDRAVLQAARRGLGAQPSLPGLGVPDRQLGVPVLEAARRGAQAVLQTGAFGHAGDLPDCLAPVGRVAFGGEPGQLADALAHIGALDPVERIAAELEDRTGDRLGQRRERRFGRALAGDVLVQRDQAAVRRRDVVVADGPVAERQELAGRRAFAVAAVVTDRVGAGCAAAGLPGALQENVEPQLPVERRHLGEHLAEPGVGEHQPIVGIPHRHADPGLPEREGEAAPHLVAVTGAEQQGSDRRRCRRQFGQARLGCSTAQHATLPVNGPSSPIFALHEPMRRPASRRGIRPRHRRRLPRAECPAA